MVAVRIRALADVERNTGRSWPGFVKRFIPEERLTVLEPPECPEQRAGFFMRRCLEPIEPTPFPSMVPFRATGSLFQVDGHDLFGVSVGGAPAYEWPLLGATFDPMSNSGRIESGRFL